MKKTCKYIASILLINSCLLFGCNNDEVDKRTLLTYGDINISSTDIGYDEHYAYDISYNDLKLKIEEKSENFMVTVMNEGCGCWDDLSYNIKKYCHLNNTICYRINLNEFNNKDNLGIDIVSSNSSFAIFENGNVKLTINTSANSKECTNENAFNEMMAKAVALPKMYFINRTNFENEHNGVLDPFSKTTVYFMRSGCKDCSNAGSSILKPYFESHRNSNNLYILDCQSIYKSQSDPNYMDYVYEKQDLYLASETNPKYGYGEGVFPTFLHFEDTNVITGAVAYNDKLITNDGVCTISESYYTSERLNYLKENYLKDFKGTSVLKGKIIPNEELTSSGRWDYSFANVYYKPLITAFLDYCLPRSNNRIK